MQTSSEAFFSEVQNMPWKRHQGAYGPATQFPDLLYRLGYGSPDEREDSYDSLYDMVFHQRTFYEVTPVVIPWLIRFLELSDVQGRDYILYLLEDMADKPPLTEEVQIPSPMSIRSGRINIVKYQPYLLCQTRAHICTGMTVYEALRQNVDETVRNAATALIETLTLDYDTRQKAIRDALHDTQNAPPQE